MAGSEELRALLERVEAATGPSYELERAIAKQLAPAGPHVPPPYTASIDAALALVKRCLDDVVWRLQTDYGDLNRCYLHQTHGVTVEEDGETPPLAILSALLSALIARTEKPVHNDDTGH